MAEQVWCPKCREKHWVCAEVAKLLKPKVDRKTYMREYMRKRRAK